MSDDREHDNEGFLRRWARVKSEARETATAPATPAPAAPQPKVEASESAPHLPSPEELTFDSDFSGFFHPKVDENLRRQALRKLFSDPHFNVMDGLDVYIDDYSKTEPIPAAMLAGLRQAQRILEWAAEKPAEKQPAADRGSGTDAEPPLADAENRQLTADTEPTVSFEVDAGAKDKTSVSARDQDP
jgi:hypothetical protein